MRDPGRAPQLANATVAQAAYDQPDAVPRALHGTRTVLMVAAAETPDRVAQHQTFVDAALAATVDHLAYTSFTGPLAHLHPGSRPLGHRAAHPRDRHGVHVPRDNLYADFVPALVGDDGSIRVPAAAERVSVVALDDISSVATAVLRAPTEYRGVTYDLTGPKRSRWRRSPASLAT